MRCTACGTPLVGPATPGDWTLERAFSLSLVAAVALAAARLMAGRFTWSGAAWTIPLGAVGIAVAARSAARVRTLGVQWCAFGGFVAFLALGETLLYRFALRGRLAAMHAAEGATEPERLGDEEWRAMDFEKFLHIEVDFAWFVALGLAIWLVVRLTRPPRAVVALTRLPAPLARAAAAVSPPDGSPDAAVATSPQPSARTSPSTGPPGP